MPKIVIETCTLTPNCCALEAVAKFMRENYVKRGYRDYMHESEIKVESGRTLKVTEEPRDENADSPCSCQFKVEKV